MNMGDRVARAEAYCALTTEERLEMFRRQDWVLLRVRQVGKCWEWQSGRTKAGYGTASIKRGMSMPAHRLAYEAFIGPIPVGMQLDHRCENPPCVFPLHLDVVTLRENIDRSADARSLRRRLLAIESLAS